MSGIAGMWHLDGRPVDRFMVRSMTEAVAHRGPDRIADWTDGSVGFGHTLLRTVPEAANEEQPLISENGRTVLVMDGRIDNREDLVRRLGLPRRALRQPDSAFVLAAYEAWGDGLLEYLLGDFAFAVWDARQRRLLLARDHFGVRPLFFVHRPGRLIAFASEVKALQAVGLVSSEPNDLKIAEFLLLPVRVEPGDTFWKNVSTVCPAHGVTVAVDEEPRQKQYWALDPERETRLDSEAAYVDRFRHLFDDAVRCRLRSSKPVGSMLSGGLDSTSIACTAARQLGGSAQMIHTFSAVFDSVPESNEREYIEATLRAYADQMRPTVFEADGIDPLACYPAMTRYMDRAVEGINSYVPFHLYESARQQGVGVILSGVDGDTTVSHGLGYYYELLWSMRWLRLWREVNAPVSRNGGGVETSRRIFRGWIKHFVRRHPLAKSVNAFLTSRNTTPRGGKTEEVLRFKPNGGAWQGSAWRKFVAGDFVRAIESSIDVREGGHPRNERDLHYKLLTRPLLSAGLHTLDAAAASAGIEVRVPFYDVRLVEYCLSLPARFKRHDGWDRWILRRAMQGVLPPEIQWRNGKANLIPTYIAGMQKQDQVSLRAFANSIGSESELCRYVNMDEIGVLVSRLLAGNLAKLDQEPERNLLLRVLALHQWFTVIPKQDVEPHMVGSM